MAGMHRHHITSEMAQPRRARDNARLKVSASEPTFRYRSNFIGSSRWPNPDASGFRKRVASEEQDVTARERDGTDPQLTLKALFPSRPKWLSDAEEQEIRERFNQYDDDHDGLLSLNELRMALKALGKYVNEIQLKELMEEMDENDSGTIELRELLDYMQRYPQPNMNTSRAVAEQEASALFATMASKNRGIQPRANGTRNNSVTGVQERVGVVDVRCDTPDEAAKVDLRAVDEFLRSEFDLEGFNEMQQEMIASGATGDGGGGNDGQVKLKDFNRVLAQGL